jgi:hypothetical protein
MFIAPCQALRMGEAHPRRFGGASTFRLVPATLPALTSTSSTTASCSIGSSVLDRSGMLGFWSSSSRVSATMDASARIWLVARSDSDAC